MAKCFDIFGNPQEFWQPCVSTGVSHCCGSTDLCMDNGMCFHADGNQAFSAGGCTSKDWEAPCNFRCDKNNIADSDTMGSFYVQYCWNTDPTSPTKTQWCCGHDCCNDGSPLFNASVAHQVYGPGKVSVLATVTGTTVITSTVTTTSTAPPVLITPEGMVTKLQYDLALGVGLGVSLGCLLVFLALLWFTVVHRWYKHHKDHKKMGLQETHTVNDKEDKYPSETSHTHDSRPGFGPHSQQTFATSTDGQTQSYPYQQQGHQQAVYGHDAQVISPLSPHGAQGPGSPAELGMPEPYELPRDSKQ